MRIVLMICEACGLLVVVGASLQRSIDIARISTLYGLLESTSATPPLDDPVFRERLDDLFETGSRLDQFMMLIGVTNMGISGWGLIQDKRRGIRSAAEPDTSSNTAHPRHFN
jgi:hypothetical protein